MLLLTDANCFDLPSVRRELFFSGIFAEPERKVSAQADMEVNLLLRLRMALSGRTAQPPAPQ